jgi:tetratricopeptide (TPR) repeat protein
VDVARRSDVVEELVADLAALAYTLGRAGKAEDAGSFVDEVWEQYRKRWVREPIDFRPGLGILPDSDGERSSDGNWRKGQIARALLSIGRIEEAAELNRQAVAVRRGHGIALARVLSVQGVPDEAEKDWRRLIAGRVYDGDAVDDPTTLARYEGGLARCLMEQGKWEEAETYLRLARPRLHDGCGTGSAWTRQLDARLAACGRRELDPWSPGGF